MSRIDSKNYTHGSGEEWYVTFNGAIQTPTFNSEGAAEAFLDGLMRGDRTPEPIKSVRGDISLEPTYSRMQDEQARIQRELKR
jgi:hypothetical protein